MNGGKISQGGDLKVSGSFSFSFLSIFVASFSMAFAAIFYGLLHCQKWLI